MSDTVPVSSAEAQHPAEEDLSPAERRRLKVRETILDAAEKVFAEEGEAGLSIRRLAEEIDYSPAAIYKYFDSKAELVTELKQAFFERLVARLQRVLSKTDAPFAACAREGVATYVRTAIERPHHYAAAFSGQMELRALDVRRKAEDTTCPLGEPATEGWAGTAFAILADMVTEGVKLGHFRAQGHPADLACSVWASCHGLAMLMVHAPDFPGQKGDAALADREAFIDFHAGLVVAGLEASPQG